MFAKKVGNEPKIVMETSDDSKVSVKKKSKKLKNTQKHEAKGNDTKENSQIALKAKSGKETILHKQTVATKAVDDKKEEDVSEEDSIEEQNENSDSVESKTERILISKQKKFIFIANYDDGNDIYKKNELVEEFDISDETKECFTTEYQYQLKVGHWNVAHLRFDENKRADVKNLLIQQVSDCDFFLFTEWKVNVQDEQEREDNNSLCKDIAKETSTKYIVLDANSEEYVYFYNPELLEPWADAKTLIRIVPGQRPIASVYFHILIDSPLKIPVEISMAHLKWHRKSELNQQTIEIFQWREDKGEQKSDSEEKEEDNKNCKVLRILLGDFNVSVKFSDGKFGKALISGSTMTNDFLSRPYDNIIVSGETDAIGEIVPQPPGKQLSDHHPVFAIIDFR